MSPLRRLRRRRERPPRLYLHEPARRTPGWHATATNWTLRRAPGDLTAAEVSAAIRPRENRPVTAATHLHGGHRT